MEIIPVTVICLCYNQAAYVRAALDSVLAQTHQPVELIIIDDSSTDNSRAEIEQFVIEYPGVIYLPLNQNMGNCKAFNQGLRLAQGKYVIDLAADDVMRPDRIAKQVAALEAAGPEAAFCFSNAVFIDLGGEITGPYYGKHRPESLIKTGDVYGALFGPNFICSPSVMFRSDYLNQNGGYDEALAYEDFDIWLRLARTYKAVYVNEVLTEKRQVPGSLSTKKNLPGEGKMLASTLAVCKKAQSLNRSEPENRALAGFVKYHLRLSVITRNRLTALGFAKLLQELDLFSFTDRLWAAAARMNLPLWFLSRFTA